MLEAAVPSLTAWANFYVITGSSAGALTGLQFVVITLIASAQRRSSNEQINAFGTPTIVHFSLALLLSAILNAPWTALPQVAVTVGLTGVGGLVYGVIVARRMRRQRDYIPVLEDVLWHLIFPLVAYAILILAAILLLGGWTPALFGVAAVTLALLFIGIHNSWDTVTFLVTEFMKPGGGGQE